MGRSATGVKGLALRKGDQVVAGVVVGKESRQELLTIAENGYGMSGQTEVEKYLRRSGLLEEYAALLRLDVISRDTSEARLIKGIRELIS